MGGHISFLSWLADGHAWVAYTAIWAYIILLLVAVAVLTPFAIAWSGRRRRRITTPTAGQPQEPPTSAPAEDAWAGPSTSEMSLAKLQFEERERLSRPAQSLWVPQNGHSGSKPAPH